MGRISAWKPGGQLLLHLPPAPPFHQPPRRAAGVLLGAGAVFWRARFITGHVSPAHLKLNLPEDWTDPATGEERHGGAFALLKDAQHRCELFMTAALGHWMGKLDEKILEKTLGSMSYITGTETEQSKSQQAPDAEQAGETA